MLTTSQSKCADLLMVFIVIFLFISIHLYILTTKEEVLIFISNYLNFLQIAQTLYNTVSKLRDLGHPEYLDITETISCSSELESLKDKV